jgi:hypothetical protein
MINWTPPLLSFFWPGSRTGSGPIAAQKLDIHIVNS